MTEVPDSGTAVPLLVDGVGPVRAKVGIAVRSLVPCDPAVMYAVVLLHPAVWAAVDCGAVYIDPLGEKARAVDIGVDGWAVCIDIDDAKSRAVVWGVPIWAVCID